MKLEPAPSLRELLSIALDHEPGAEEAGFDKEEVLQVRHPPLDLYPYVTMLMHIILLLFSLHTIRSMVIEK